MTAKTQRSILGIPGKRYVRVVVLATEYDDTVFISTTSADIIYFAVKREEWRFPDVWRASNDWLIESTWPFHDTHAGFGIMCDNNDIYCDSEDYYCDGSVVMRDIKAVTEKTTVYGNRHLIYDRC